MTNTAEDADSGPARGAPADQENGDARPFFTLVRDGQVYAPEPLGRRTLLLAGDRVLRIVDAEGPVLRSIERMGAPYQEIDAAGLRVLPGLIDPHEHLIGAGGEQGFRSRTPEVPLPEIVLAGITTVVGVIGADSTTRDLRTLLGKVRELDARGITAYMYTGAFRVPAPSITGSVMDDVILIDKVLGVGEIAIADIRSLEPEVSEVARMVSEAMLGGTIGGKCGVTHFHVGPAERRLAGLRALIDEHDVQPPSLYPTHLNRSEALMDEGMALAAQGAFVDLDTVDDDLPRWCGYYLAHGGRPDRLTISSDAAAQGGSPAKLYRNFVRCVRQSKLPLEVMLPLATRNTARVLGLRGKGRIAEGSDADLLLVDEDTLDVVHVFARGRQLVRKGRYVDG